MTIPLFPKRTSIYSFQEKKENPRLVKMTWIERYTRYRAKRKELCEKKRREYEIYKNEVELIKRTYYQQRDAIIHRYECSISEAKVNLEGRINKLEEEYR